jgi:HEAT repeat protein
MYIDCTAVLILALALGAGFQSPAPGGKYDLPLIGTGPLPTTEETLQKHGILLTVPALVQALKSTDPEVRWLAASKLAQDNVKEAVPAIRGALASEKVQNTRVNLAFSLAQIGEAEGFVALRSVCGDSDTRLYLKTMATRYLLYLGREDETCRNALVDGLHSRPDSDTLRESVTLLLRFRNLSTEQSQVIFQSALDALSSPEPARRVAASIALADIGKSSAVPYLQSAIATENDDAVRSAMERELLRLQRKEKRLQPTP